MPVVAAHAAACCKVTLAASACLLWSLQGRYSFKLLAVDVPSAVGRQQRIFLEGDEKGYSRGGIMGELRDPFIRVGLLCIDAMTACWL